MILSEAVGIYSIFFEIYYTFETRAKKDFPCEIIWAVCEI